MRLRTLTPLLLALPLLIALLSGGVQSIPAPAPVDGDEVQRRITSDLQRGDPVVVHLVVALCDNKYQGIVPVPERIGNGQEPASNLYWGAAYGVRTYLTGKGGWKLLHTSAPGGGVLQRIVLHKKMSRAGAICEAYLVADAWDGKEIQRATERFLRIAAGEEGEDIRVKAGDSLHQLSAGGRAHLVAYIGHNGLMDFSIDKVSGRSAGSPVKSSMVLACASRPYFAERLRTGGSHPLLLTTGLMAPEAYIVAAAVDSWLAGRPPADVREAAAAAYNRFQRCGLKAARNLFFSEP